MTRAGVGLAMLLAAAGCGSVSTLDFEHMGPAVVATHAAPDALAVSENALASTLVGGAKGYVWLGYTVATIATMDLSEYGSGDGFSLGLGFRLSDSGRSYLELGVERSLKHLAPASLGNDDVDRGVNERLLFGFRTTSAPRARMQNHPRPYMDVGLAYCKMATLYPDGAGFDKVSLSGMGYYGGIGVEFPAADSGALSFDTKFYTWDDSDGSYGNVAISMYWMSKF